jgi:CheY-like chemotaxis protein
VNCPYCQNRVSPSHTFCASCGLHVPPAASAAAARPVDPSRPFVLIFEDDPFFGGMMSTKFEMAGFRVRWFEHPPKDVVALVVNEQPQVISMGVIMPVMDGFEATELLKRDPRTKRIPLFILSNLNQKADVERARALGADDYIIKASSTPDRIVEKARGLIASRAADH